LRKCAGPWVERSGHFPGLARSLGDRGDPDRASGNTGRVAATQVDLQVPYPVDSCSCAHRRPDRAPACPARCRSSRRRALSSRPSPRRTGPLAAPWDGRWVHCGADEGMRAVPEVSAPRRGAASSRPLSGWNQIRRFDRPASLPPTQPRRRLQSPSTVETAQRLVDLMRRFPGHAPLQAAAARAMSALDAAGAPGGHCGVAGCACPQSRCVGGGQGAATLRGSRAGRSGLHAARGVCVWAAGGGQRPRCQPSLDACRLPLTRLPLPLPLCTQLAQQQCEGGLGAGRRRRRARLLRPRPCCACS
jgi:hypothetical protein